jgi:hypothetical protein
MIFNSSATDKLQRENVILPLPAILILLDQTGMRFQQTTNTAIKDRCN